MITLPVGFGIFTRRAVAVVALTAVLVASPWVGAGVVAQDGVTWPDITRSAPVEKEFAVTRHFNYRERFYTPRVAVKIAKRNPGPYFSNAEQLALSNIAAMYRGDFDWWLSTLTSKARESIEGQIERGETSREALEAQWASEFADNAVTLERFIETGSYFIITYRLWSPKQVVGEAEKAKFKKEHVIVVSTSQGLWQRSFDLDDDPVVRYFDDQRLKDATSLRIETVIGK